MKTKEMRELNSEEIKKFADEQRSQAVKLRFDISARQTKNHRDYRKSRKDIAKAMTILKEREMESAA